MKEMTPEICLWRAVLLETLWAACGDLPLEPTTDLPKPGIWTRKGPKPLAETQYRYFMRDRSVWRRAKREKEESRRWLLADDRDFPIVCGFAAWNADDIRERVTALAEKGWPVLIPEKPDFAKECLAANTDAEEMDEAA